MRPQLLAIFLVGAIAVCNTDVGITATLTDIPSQESLQRVKIVNNSPDPIHIAESPSKIIVSPDEPGQFSPGEPASEPPPDRDFNLNLQLGNANFRQIEAGGQLQFEIRVPALVESITNRKMRTGYHRVTLIFEAKNGTPLEVVGRIRVK